MDPNSEHTEGQDAAKRIKQLERELKQMGRKLAKQEGLTKRIDQEARMKSNLGAAIMEERAREERYLSLLLQGSPDIIFLVDADGRLAYCTQAFLKETGIESFGLLNGRLISEVLHPYRSEEDSVIAKGILESVLHGTEMVVEQEFDFKLNGAPRMYRVSVSPLQDENSQVDGAILIYHDETDIRRAQQEAEAANEAKSAFLARTSHEIRTPMNAIVGMSELLLQENLSAACVEYAVNIKQAGANLLAIINDILDFSKIESGRMEIVTIDYQLASLVNDVVNLTRMKIVSRPIQFVTFIDADLPFELEGDIVRIRQILTNLLNNAMKYTEEGLVRFSITGNKVEEDSIQLVMSVEDTGIGIKSGDQEKLFDDFSQVDQKNNVHIEGTGLGLAISRNLAKAMGGNITVTSEYGKGSKFTFTVTQKIVNARPAAEVEEADSKKVLIFVEDTYVADSAREACDSLKVKTHLVKTLDDYKQAVRSDFYTHVLTSHSLFDCARSKIGSKNRGASFIVASDSNNTVAISDARVLPMPLYSITLAFALNDRAEVFRHRDKSNAIEFEAPSAQILVVDDIFTNLRVAEALMTSANMQIEKSTRGEDAVKMATQTDYDIIFMDHMMPGMSGIEATEKIRRVKGDKPVIIALTANAVSGMREMFLENGFNDFLAKPIEIAKLNAILDKWIPDSKKQKPGDKSSSPQDTVTFRIPGVDIEQGLALSGGSMESYMEILAAFVSDCETFQTLMPAQIDQANIDQYATRIHGIKGAAATLGARVIADRARLLEEAAKRQDIDYVNRNSSDFYEHLNEFLAVTRTILRPSDEVRGDDADLVTQLKILRQNLEDFKIGEADALVSNIAASHWGNDTDMRINKISDNILMSDYDEAVVEINQLISANTLN